MDWLNSAGKIIKLATRSDLYNQFSHLKTDYERTKFLHDNKQLLASTIEKYLKQSTKNSKDVSKATSYRKQGNDCFVTKKLGQAAWCYRVSIAMSNKNSQDMALSYGNLSAVLFELCRYHECLRCIQLAQDYGYPNELKFKLVFRRAACYHKLDDLIRSSYELKIAAELIKHANGLDRKKLESYCKEMEQLSHQIEETLSKKLYEDYQREAENMTSNNKEKKRSYKNLDEFVDNSQSLNGTITLKLSSSKNNNKSKVRSSISPPSPSRNLEDLEICRPQLYHGRNEEIPCCSFAIRMNYTEDKGRHLIAQNLIPSNKIILVEKPYSWLLLPNYSYTYCDHCLKLIVIPFVCPNCSHVLYCSEYCQNYSLTNYHQYECGYIHVLKTLGIAYLAYRTIILTGLERLLTQKTKKVSNHYYSNYESVKNLITHAEQMSTDDLFHYSLTAYFLSEIIKKTKFIRQTSNIQEQIIQQLIIASHLLRHIQQMIFNSQTISVKRKNIKSKRQQKDPTSTGNTNTIKEQQHQTKKKKKYNKNGTNNVRNDTKARVNDISNNVNKIDDIDDDLYYDNLSEKEDDMFVNEKRLATALFPTCSLMNHSCVPNVTCSFYNALLIVKTSRTILTGEELCNSYGPLKSNLSTELRQSALYEQYYFKCLCDGCVEVTPTNGEKIESTKKNLPLSSAVTTCVLATKNNKSEDSNEQQATLNTSNLVYLNWMEKLAEAKKRFSNGTNCLILYEQQTNHFDLWQKGLIYLEEARLLYENVINELNLDSVHIYDYIAKIYNDEQDYENCSSCLNRSLSILTTYVHSYSIDYLLDDLRKYAQTLFNSRKFENSLLTCEQALEFIQKHSLTSTSCHNIKNYLKNIEDLKAECELCIKMGL
ncbi:unnamed protein product [Didymodactylos carnosus]|uniref:Protein-lysine N-methyltransferase SMYD4 n=1 Tax=Didymodactylos carnosus TaxID=1234261 RepID=A0A815ACA5_9BILA|nr:unnamed protein product [Didymodactylos carnosus]CAF1253727.1 unnamed protein product [Didymodactylos carnosus]CAF3499752.1 unnamed protein product [Didymodactylos carnosus]CAF4024777.1 unnamed protein product [Didymodactylos carnosus]